MKKTLCTLLVASVFAAGCEMTDAGRAWIGGLFTHGIKEGISGELNPSGTNVNVYGNGQEQEGQGNQGTDPYMFPMKQVKEWIPPPYSFVCTGVKDNNNDGYYGRDELQDLGTYFECKKLEETHPIIFGASWTNIKGRNVSCRVKEKESEKLIAIGELGMAEYNSWISMAQSNVRKKPGECGVHSYLLEWYVDGQKIPTRTLEFFIDYGKKEVSQEQSTEKESEEEK